jgi:hypothetical protein
MCHCLGRAVKRHVDFSRSSYWFLDDLNDAKANEKAFGFKKEEVPDLEDSTFSY